MTLASASTLRSRIVAAGYDWIVPSWPAPPNVCAFATTKNGGVSAGRYATLNLGASNGDDPAAVAANCGRNDTFTAPMSRYSGTTQEQKIHARRMPP